MATAASCDNGTIKNGSRRRGVAMVLAMVTAVVLSPLYVNNTSNDGQNEAAHYFLENSSRLWNSGFVLPMLLAGLIVAIKTTSSSSSASFKSYDQDYSSSSSSRLLIRIGSSSRGLAGILGMLAIVCIVLATLCSTFFSSGDIYVQ